MEVIDLDSLYTKIKDIVLKERISSTSYIQRTLDISYEKANTIIKQLEDMKIVDKPNKNGIRKILIEEKMHKREFTEDEKKHEAFVRTSNVLYSHWKISNNKEKETLQCGGHSRLFEILIPDCFITKGESIKGKGHREHIVPCALIRCHAYEMFNNGYLIEDIANMIKENLIIIHITKEEQVKIDVELGYKETMPENWEFGQSPYARLDIGEIDIKFYEV